MRKYLILLIIPLLFNSCDNLPTSFKSPNFDTNIHFPITEKSYTLDEIIKINKNIQIDSSSGNGNLKYKLVSDDYIQNFVLQDFLKDQLNGSYENLEFFVATKDTLAYIDIASGASIDSAFMAGGDFEISIDNKSKGEVSFTVGMPNLKENGTSFEIIGNVGPNAKTVVNKSLTNHAYSSKDQPLPTQMLWRVKMVGQFNGEKVNVSLKITKTKLGFVQGNIPSKDLAPITRSIGLPLTNDVKDFRDKFNLRTATLFVKANYLSPVKNIYNVLLKDVKIVGKRNGAGTMQLKNKDGSDNFGNFSIENGNYLKAFNNDNSNISEFLSFLPDSITLSTGITVNPNNKSGAATENDSIRITVSFNALSNIDITNYTRFDTLALEMDASYRDEIRNGRYAKIFYEVTNGIPLKNDFNIIFADAKSDSLFSHKISINGATVGNNEIVTSTLPLPASTFELDSAEIIKLSNAYKVIIGLKTETPPGNSTNIFKPDMKIKIKSYGEIKYHIKTDK